MHRKVSVFFILFKQLNDKITLKSKNTKAGLKGFFFLFGFFFCNFLIYVEVVY